MAQAGDEAVEKARLWQLLHDAVLKARSELGPNSAGLKVSDLPTLLAETERVRTLAQALATATRAEEDAQPVSIHMTREQAVAVALTAGLRLGSDCMSPGDRSVLRHALQALQRALGHVKEGA